MKFIVGKKQEMTQIFQDNGEVVPVTILKAGPCIVTQVKTKEKDGYKSVQIGFGKKNKINKPLSGHLKGFENFQYLKEFRTESDIKKGDKITVETFEAGEQVKVTAQSKGKGFQGVVKRHGFKGASATHGTKDQERMPGSAGATGPAHVFKGRKMPGQTGNVQVTLSNLELIKIDPENNLLYVKGAVPGHRQTIVLISAQGELKVNIEPKLQEPEAKQENQENKEEKNENDQPVKQEDNKEEKKQEEKPQEESIDESSKNKDSDKEKSKENEPVKEEDKKEETKQA